MKVNDRIERCLDDATAGLSPDPELRADVRAELESHVRTAAAEYESTGLAAAESMQRALESFGPVVDLAAELVDANRHRMRLRAWLRVTLRWLVVPASVALALFVAAFMLGRVQQIVSGFRELSVLYPLQPDSRRWHAVDVPPGAQRDVISVLNTGDAFYFIGDSSREGYPAQQRAIWEAHPRNKVFYANYVSALCAQGDLRDLEFIERELSHAAQVDAENSRYDYILAYAIAESACKIERSVGGFESPPRIRVNDRDRLEQAVDIILRANAKPVFRRYTLSMLKRRLAILPPAGRIEQLTQRADFIARQTQPDTVILKKLARIVSAYTDSLVEEGRLDRAKALFDTWRHLVRLLNDDAFSYVDMLAIKEITRSADVSAPRPQAFLAAAWTETARRIASVVAHGGDARLVRQARPPGELQRRGSLFARLVTPQRDMPPFPPTVPRPQRGEPVVAAQSGSAIPAAVRAGAGSQFDYTRWAEHVFVEQAAVSVALLALVLMMAGSGIVALRYHRHSCSGAADLLIMPSWSRWMELVGFTLLAPLIVYVLYSRFSDFSGREFGISYLGHRFALEMLLLIATLLGFYRLAALRHVRARCRDLGLSVPPRAPGWSLAVACFCVAFLWGLSFSMRGEESIGGRDLAIAVAFPVGVTVLIATWRWLHTLLCGSSHGTFHRVAARSMVPICAVAVLLVGLLMPVLLHEEGRYLKNERLYEWSAGKGVANTEYERVLRMRDEVRRILKGLGA